MTKIIIINHANPFAKGGGSYASRAYMKAFAEWSNGGADICLDAESQFIEDRTILASQYYKVKKRSNVERVLSLFSGDIQRYTSFIKKHLSCNPQKYKWAIISGAVEGGALVDIFHRYRVKVVTIHHNYEPEYIYDNTSVPLLKNILRFHSFNLQKKAYRKSDLNLFLTSDDAIKCESEYGETQATNKIIGVFEYDCIPPLPKSSDNENPTFVITGQLDNPQGIDSVEYFFSELYTYIPKECKIIIAGKNPSQRIRNLCAQYNNVQLVPNPEDMRLVISSGDIYVCPTRVGGGLKLRVLDGLKLGLPVIVHKCSARGYDAYHNSPYFLQFENALQFKAHVDDMCIKFKTKANERNRIYNTYVSTFSYETGLQNVRIIMEMMQ